MILIEVFSRSELICICKSFCMAVKKHLYKLFVLHYKFYNFCMWPVTNDQTISPRAFIVQRPTYWHFKSNGSLIVISMNPTTVIVFLRWFPKPAETGCDSLCSSYRKKAKHRRPSSSLCRPTLLSPVQAASQWVRLSGLAPACWIIN